MSIINRRITSITEMKLFDKDTGRLATANSSRVSMRSTKSFANAGDVVDLVRMFVLSSSITMQSSVAVRHTVWAYVRGPKKFVERCGPLE